MVLPKSDLRDEIANKQQIFVGEVFLSINFLILVSIIKFFFCCSKVILVIKLVYN